MRVTRKCALDEARDLISGPRPGALQRAFLDSLGWEYYNRTHRSGGTHARKAVERESTTPTIRENWAPGWRTKAHGDCVVEWEKSLNEGTLLASRPRRR